MTPEEKAKKLVFKYFHLLGGTTIKDNAIIHSNTKIWKEAKQCALIAVEEIIKTCNEIVQSSDVAPYYDESYWNDVKHSIENM